MAPPIYDWLGAVKHEIRRVSALPPDDPIPESRISDGPPRSYGRLPAGAMGGGVRAQLTETDQLMSPLFGIEAPLSPDDRWRELDLDANTLTKMRPFRLLELLADLSPDVSRALWDFQRMTNPGWEVEIIKGPAAATTWTKDFIKYIKGLYGSFDIPINRWYIGGFLRGAFWGELVMDGRGQSPVDIATPDPQSARFRKVKDPIRGKVWQLGQIQDGKWVPLDVATIKYIPIDPMPDSPYGRALASPALFTCIFLIGLMHDLRRVVAQQGYPRLDLELSLDELTRGLDEDVISNAEEFRKLVVAAVAEVEKVYAALEPDDAYIHTSAVKVGRPVGAVDSSSLGAVSGLISALERQVIRALKTMPLLMGVNEASSETHANRQWEVYAAGIKALQHLAESMLEYLLTLALQSQGYAAEVQFRFAELRASEEMRDAQTEQLRIGNAQRKFFYGWQSHRDSSVEVTGKPPVNKGGPLYIEKTWQPIALLGAQTDKAKADAKNAKNPPKPAAPVEGEEADENKPAEKEDGTEKALQLEMPLIGGAAGDMLVRVYRRGRFNREVVEHVNGEG